MPHFIIFVIFMLICPNKSHTAWNKGKPCRQSTKLKIQEHHLAHPELFQFWLGKKRSKKTIEKLILSHVGKSSWNKGISREELLFHYPNGLGQGMKGKCHSLKTKKLLRQSQLGKYVPSEIGKKISETKKIMYANGTLKPYMLGKHHSKSSIIKMSIKQKNRPVEITRKCLLRICPSGLESEVIRIMNKFDLPYKFVGDGKFFIGRKNPDFVHDSKRIIVEVFCKKHKDKFRGGCKLWMSSRRKYFSRHGWKSIFIERDCISEKNILKRCS